MLGRSLPGSYVMFVGRDSFNFATHAPRIHLLPNRRTTHGRGRAAANASQAYGFRDGRCFLRALGLISKGSGFSQIRDHLSYTCLEGGQGQDRTVDLTIFSRALVPTELPGLRQAVYGRAWLWRKRVKARCGLLLLPRRRVAG
jgi:hypothetical protein